MNGAMVLRYDPQLMEDAVFLAMRTDARAGAFHQERSLLYNITASEARDAAFQELHLKWLTQLGLADPIEKAIKEQPLLTSAVGLYVIARAPRKTDEGAELFVSPDAGLKERERRTVRILLRPESLLDLSRLSTFLRHECLHLVDMLDPSFGYKPALPAAEGGPSHERLLKERYRVLWDITIDGRMVRRGWAAASLRDERLGEFG